MGLRRVQTEHAAVLTPVDEETHVHRWGKARRKAWRCLRLCELRLHPSQFGRGLWEGYGEWVVGLRAPFAICSLLFGLPSLIQAPLQGRNPVCHLPPCLHTQLGLGLLRCFLLAGTGKQSCIFKLTETILTQTLKPCPIWKVKDCLGAGGGRGVRRVKG